MAHFEIGDVLAEPAGEFYYFKRAFFSQAPQTAPTSAGGSFPTGSFCKEQSGGSGIQEFELPGLNFPLWVNADGIAGTISNMGKANSAMVLTALLGNPQFDFSRALLISSGCAGGAAARVTIGDVSIAQATVDGDAGHYFSPADLSPGESEFARFADFDHFFFCKLSPEVVDFAFEAAQSAELLLEEPNPELRGVLEQTKKAYGDSKIPQIRKGVTLSSDNYWHGISQSNLKDEAVRAAAELAGEAWEGYTTSECEDNALAAVAQRFGALGRFISVRSVVNYTHPPSSETSPRVSVDLPSGGFDLGMKNNFLATSAIIQAWLNRAEE